MNKCRTTLALIYYITEKENNLSREFDSNEILEELSNLYTSQAQAASTLQYFRKRGLLHRRRGHGIDKKRSPKNFYKLTPTGFNRGKYYFMESKKNDVDTSFVLWLKINK